MTAVNVVLRSQTAHSNSLAHDYWAIGPDGRWLHTLETLCERTGLTRSAVINTVKVTSYAALPQFTCDCGYAKQITTRSEWKIMASAGRRHRWVCLKCREAREAATLKERASGLSSAYKRVRASAKRMPDLASRLSYEDAAALTALLMMEGNSPCAISPLMHERTMPFACSKRVGQELVEGLIKRSLLVPASDTSDGLSLGPHGELQLDLETVTLAVPLHEDEDPESFLDSLLARIGKGYSSESDRQAVIGLMHRAARWECEAYLDGQLKRLNFRWTPDYNSLQPTWSRLLDHFSVSQAFYFIWVTLQAQSRAKTDGGPGDKWKVGHQAFVRYIDRIGETAKAEHWVVRGYNRTFDVPLSCMSVVAFMTLGDGDALQNQQDVGFALPIRELLNVLDARYSFEETT